jgi:hypothetical protein
MLLNAPVPVVIGMFNVIVVAVDDEVGEPKVAAVADAMLGATNALPRTKNGIRAREARLRRKKFFIFSVYLENMFRSAGQRP